MTSPSIDITWSLAEAEAAYAGFSEIGLAHFWVGICKAVAVSVPELLKAGSPEIQALGGQVEADFLEVLEALVERWDPLVSSAVTKLGHDPYEVLRGLIGERQKAPRRKTQEKRKKDVRAVAEDEEMPKKKSALERFGRDLTALAAAGALPPLIGRRKEMLKITQVLLQSRKNNLILVGEPGVGKTGIVEGFAQLMAEGKLPEALGWAAVIEISLPSLVAGTKYRGEFDEGTLTDAQGKKCDFRESGIILTSNLGSGGGAVKPFIGFAVGDQPAVSPAKANELREEEAIREHLRSELVNRLTKVVHFKPLGIETAREVLGKLMEDFNKRLADKGVKVELTGKRGGTDPPGWLQRAIRREEPGTGGGSLAGNANRGGVAEREKCSW